MNINAAQVSDTIKTENIYGISCNLMLVPCITFVLVKYGQMYWFQIKIRRLKKMNNMVDINTTRKAKRVHQRERFS